MAHGSDTPRILNITSAVSSSIILAAVVGIAIYQRELASRVSFRLQGAVALCDLMNHIVGNYYTFAKGSGCVAAGFFRTFGRVMFCFYNISIAFNLQYIYLHGFIPSSRHELYLWMVPLVMGLIMNLVPLFLGVFGPDSRGHSCFFTSSQTASVFKYININGVIILTFAYCFTIAGLVIIRLLRDQPEQGPKKIHHHIRQLVLRVALYPLTTFIILSGYCVLHLMMALNGNNPFKVPMQVINWSIYSSNLAGTLNLLAFLFDPSFIHAVKVIFKLGYSQNLNLATSCDFQVTSVESESDNQFSTDKYVHDSQFFSEDEAYKALIRRF